MKARDIDDDGYWIADGSETLLLGSMIAVPKKLRVETGLEEEEVLFLSNAESYLSHCPKCGSRSYGIILNTEHFRLFPAKCCNTLIWRSISNEYENHRIWIEKFE